MPLLDGLDDRSPTPHRCRSPLHPTAIVKLDREHAVVALRRFDEALGFTGGRRLAIEEDVAAGEEAYVIYSAGGALNGTTRGLFGFSGSFIHA